jgi:hypothetical protein
MSFMSAPDERTGETFSFEHLRSEEAAGLSGWGWQREFFLWMYDGHRTITLKARQLGATWIGCGACVVDTLILPGSLCLIYRQKEEEAVENVRRCWSLFCSLPPHLRMGVEVITPARGALPSTEMKLRHPSGEISRIVAMSSASASGHGKTARRVLLDEHSRIDRVGEITKAVQPAAGKTGRIAIISTANGVSNPDTGEGNQFHWTWVNADTAGWQKRFLPWSSHPDRDQVWYDNDPEVRGLKSHERAEQYPANEDEAFTLTNRTFFDPDDLAAYYELVGKPLYRADFVVLSRAQARLKRRSDGRLTVYADPKPDRKYAIGVDVASGRGRDWSVAYVVDLSNMELAAEYRARLDADIYATQLHYLGRFYNTATIAVETAGGWGEAVIIPLRDGREGRPPYPKMYRHIMSSRPSLDEARVFGFPTNMKTRPLILNQFEKAVRERALPFVTRALLDEMKTFNLHDHGTSPRAQDGAHDDCVMACAISLEMFRLYGFHPDFEARKKTRRKRRGGKSIYPWMPKRLEGAGT